MTIPTITAALEPVDQPARDRIRADHDHTLFVVAGAGTGKTAALVSRVVALVAAGRTQLDDLAAITFTEAAAAELRDRIRGALELAARGDDPNVGTPDGRSRCARARAGIDEAALTTLHGFAQRVLARFPIEAGVPPRFEVVDEIAAAITFDEGWRELSEKLLADPALEAPLLTALTLDVGMRRWRDITATLHANWDRVPDPDASEGDVRIEPSVVPDVAPLVEAITGAWAMREKCDAPADKLLACIDSLRSTIEVLTTALEVGGFELLETLVELQLPKARNYGVQANWSVPKSDVKAALDAVSEARDDCIDAVGRAVLDAVAPRLCAWVRARARERAAAGRLEYHDLLVLARDLLRGDEQVRRAVAQRYRFVLLDEFQDTDPLQAELAALLAAAADPAGRAWHDITVEPGRLFFVGDPKQSIYRFRRADLLLYHRAAHRFGEHTVELATNFRSTPGVIGWVNDVFDGLLRDSAAEIQAEPARLAAHRPALTDHLFDGPPVATFGTPLPESAAELRVREAAGIAGLVQSIVGRWRVVDPRTQAVRAARHHDIAILLPTRLSLDAVDRALDDADIAARVESRSLVFATSEVRDLLAILQAVDDPADPLAVVTALRSPGLACSDRALAEWALAGARWDYRVAPPHGIGGDHDVAVAMATLARLHQARHSRSVSDTVGAVISECGLDLVAIAHRRPRDRWRRIRFLLEHARAWDGAGDGATLRGFVEWARRQADENATAIEMPAPELDDDAVRILTMHGAKGLEFPIVILGGLAASPVTMPAEVLFDDSGPLFRAGRQGMELASAGYAEQREREKAHVAAERARLLYVAATRARDHLLVSQHYNAQRQTYSFAAMLAAHLDRHPVPMLDHTDHTDAAGHTGAAESSGTPTLGLEWTGHTHADADVTYDALVAADATRRDVIAAAAVPRVVAATRVRADLAAEVDPAAEAARNADDDEALPGVGSGEPVWPRGRAGTAIGRAVDAVMQHADLADAATILALARAQAQAEQIPEHEGEVAALAARMHAAAVVREAATRRHWREVPVAAQIEGMLVEGYVDLLYENADGALVVVDYKTDRVDDARDVATLAASYTPQAAAYALALETALGRTVASAVLLFVTPTGAVAREVSDLPGAVDTVRNYCRRASG